MTTKLTASRFLVMARHFSTHAAHSGLLPLVAGLPHTQIKGRERSLWRYPSRFQWFRQRVFEKSRHLYGHQSASRETGAILRMARSRSPGLVMYLWGDFDYLYGGRFARRFGGQTAAWFHTVPALLPQFIPAPQSLRYLDLVFCVSRSQIPFFQQHLPAERVHFLPLGVDTDYFTPDETIPYRPLCLFVGSTLRDYALFKAVCERIRAQLPTVELIAVLPPKAVKRMPDIPGLLIQTEVNDDTLRHYYRTASLLLLPLEDCSSSISLTESIACGTPVVTNRVGGVPDYLDESCAFLHPPGDAEGMAESALCLLTDSVLNQRMRHAARAHALNFSWEKIQARLLALYQEVLGVVP